MRNLVIAMAAAFGAATTFAADAKLTPHPVELENPGFEDGAAGWSLPRNAAIDASVALPGDLAKPGATLALKLEVVNIWPNRLIGDSIARRNGAAEPTSKRGPWPQWVLDGKADSGTGIYTWSNFMGWSPDEPLLPAGLLGPVSLLTVK